MLQQLPYKEFLEYSHSMSKKRRSKTKSPKMKKLKTIGYKGLPFIKKYLGVYSLKHNTTRQQQVHGGNSGALIMGYLCLTG